MDHPNGPLVPKAASEPAAAGPPKGRAFSQIFYGPKGLRPGWRLLVFFFFLSLFFALTAWLLGMFLHHRPVTSVLTPQLVLLGEAVPLLLVLIASWIMAKMEGGTIADYGLPLQGAFGAKFWQGVAMGFAAISGLLGAMRLSGVLHMQGMALGGTDIWKYAFVWAIAFLFVALFEEFLFRGYALFTLMTGIGFWPAAVVSSMAFGYVHHRNPGENWMGVFNAGLVGLLFCLLLRRSGNLWMPIGFHAAWDWGETYFWGVADSGQVAPAHLFTTSFAGPVWLTGGTVGPEGSYLCAGLLVLLGLIFATCLSGPNYPNPAAIGRLTAAPAVGPLGREGSAEPERM